MTQIQTKARDFTAFAATLHDEVERADPKNFPDVAANAFGDAVKAHLRPLSTAQKLKVLTGVLANIATGPGDADAILTVHALEVNLAKVLEWLALSTGADIRPLQVATVKRILGNSATVEAFLVG